MGLLPFFIILFIHPYMRYFKLLWYSFVLENSIACMMNQIPAH